ncbi:hypothetical protein CWC05_09980 [Pseudoalteromonas ruthenica]|uniref:DUF600 domain-containing protein n=1 Tax=Pseudoalteromonas ruthenica TaxID=151081 RepID=A0A5S3Z3J8_9GAMM|nr:hypothetical protein [Pseudoalteromonas ruthenica]TMO50020.1 hypothetical protein CWC24_00950 [Pseudoalteromonas ruthenica]TMO52396.1 hypothetical protein CWC23_02710 [Pseudoalteromonas ruthenica]TMP86802.1 hypothetical protein CWC05_09980 [Pseudoalteromonas ruthenica]
MNISVERLQQIADLFLRCKDVVGNPWTAFAFVFEFNEGHIANSGFLYNNDKVEPATARIEDDLLLLEDTLLEFREEVYEQCDWRFIKLLFQMDGETERFKIDFEFEDKNRWEIHPGNMMEMREELRPHFD